MRISVSGEVAALLLVVIGLTAGLTALMTWGILEMGKKRGREDADTELHH